MKRWNTLNSTNTIHPNAECDTEQQYKSKSTLTSVCVCLYNKLKWPHCTTQHLLTLAASIRFGSFLRYRMLLLQLIVCFSVGAPVCISFTLYTAVQKPYTSSRLHANTLRYRHRSVHCTLTHAHERRQAQAQCESVCIEWINRNSQRRRFGCVASHVLGPLYRAMCYRTNLTRCTNTQPQRYLNGCSCLNSFLLFLNRLLLLLLAIFKQFYCWIFVNDSCLHW